MSYSLLPVVLLYLYIPKNAIPLTSPQISSLFLSVKSPSSFAKIRFTPSNVYNLLSTLLVAVLPVIDTVSSVVVPSAFVNKLSNPPTMLNPLCVYRVVLSSKANPFVILFKV